MHFNLSDFTKDIKDIIDQEFNDLFDQWLELTVEIVSDLIERYEKGEATLLEESVNPAQVN